MGHEVIVYGRILGASGLLQDRNRAIINRMPREDQWPWLVRGMFSLPAGWPQGTYRSQVIHFGASIKDDPTDRGIWDVWLGKFEGLLGQLYWWSAAVHLETEFERDRVFEWLPTEAAMQG